MARGCWETKGPQVDWALLGERNTGQSGRRKGNGTVNLAKAKLPDLGLDVIRV